MSGTVVASVVSALCVLAGVLYTQRQLRKAAERTADVEERKVDAEAYDRARTYDREVVKGLREDLQRAREEIAALRRTLEGERREHERETREHERETRELRMHVDRLEMVVARLTRRLREAGLDVEEPDR